MKCFLTDDIRKLNAASTESFPSDGPMQYPSGYGDISSRWQSGQTNATIT